MTQHFPELFLYLVDSWQTYSPEDAYRVSGDSCAAFTAEQQLDNYQATIMNTDATRGRCRFMRTSSTIAAQQLHDETLDFAFIDANHTYEAVKADILAWWPKIRPGGILTGHDYRAHADRRGIWGVSRAVNEFAATRQLSVGTHPAHVWSLDKPAISELASDRLPQQSHRAERGVILFNRGQQCLVRMLVCVASLRKWWRGPVTAFLEGVHSPQFEQALRHFNVDIARTENPSAGAFIRKVEICLETPYERSLWLDSDTVVCGPIEPLFGYLDEHEIVTPHFAGWWSHQRPVLKRIEQYRGKCPDEWLVEAQRPHPAVNMGVYAFRADAAFLRPWLELSRKGDHGQVTLPEEIAFQILYPKYSVGIAPAKFNVSVKHDPQTPDPCIVHYHGRKHVREFPLCDHWKQTFSELLSTTFPQASSLLGFADRRLKQHVGIVKDVTFVTACDRNYVEKLRITFPNWVKFKRVDQYPLIVFVNGIPLDDPTLDFLRLPCVRLIEWDMPAAADQRERMLSAFVFGTARHVETRFWMKIDADAYATNDVPLVSESMKEYAIFGHRWGSSRAHHIQALDEWAAKHRRLGTPPMYDAQRIKGDKFLHPRTASYIQLQSTRLTRFCAKLAGDRLPVPSHDTYLFYIADRLGFKIGRENFKAARGFDNCSRLRGLKMRVSS